MNFGKKVVIVTGAGERIGRAVAEKYGEDGAFVIVADIDSEAGKETRDCIIKNNGNAVFVKTDVAKEEDCKNLAEEAVKKYGRIDILINNAGLAVGLDPIHKGVLEDWERMIDTNVKGLLYVTRVVSPSMVARKSGHIINIGSIAGKDVYPNGVVYCATKHAVDALSKGMRMDFLPYNIKVTQICPGAVETEFSLVRFKGDQDRADQVYIGFENLIADDIAEAVNYAVSQPAHVDIQDMLVMPTAQASGSLFHKETK